MKCPFCSFPETKVVDKRDSEEGTTRRRRECMKCAKRFTTYERPEISEIIVIKKDGSREPFDRGKVLKGVVRACEKRPIALNVMEHLTDEVEVELRSRDMREVTSRKIGEMVIKRLRKIDKVAYIRFASVYREFADLTDFEDEVKKLLRK
jgi:transcriptional repressor NrdR